MQNKIRKIQLVDEMLNFHFVSNTAPEELISIKAGPNYIIENFFLSEYPKESEIEKALNYIEYELTKNHTLQNNGETLNCKNALLADVLNVTEQKTISKGALEQEFDKYVDCAYGEPARILGIDFSPEKLTILMLIRCAMYYLGFDYIDIFSE